MIAIISLPQLTTPDTRLKIIFTERIDLAAIDHFRGLQPAEGGVGCVKPLGNRISTHHFGQPITQVRG